MSAEVIDLTVDYDDASPLRRAKRARPARAHAASAAAEVIDLSRDEEAAAAAGGACGGGGVQAPFTCAVCFCDYGPEEGHALFCGHLYCRDCLRAHCKTQVGDGLPDAAGIFCPEPRCRAPLTGADISAVADEATAARFEELALEKLILSNSDMGCCPTPGCTYMFAWDPANRKLQCPKCNRAYCVVCKTDWHRGVRCEARGERDEQAEFEKAAVRGHYKKCPTCSVWVEKAEGCDSMRCRCGASFCYRCGSQMDRQHAAHKCVTPKGSAYYRSARDW